MATKKSKKITIVLLVAISTILLIGIAIYFLATSPDNQNNTSSITPPKSKEDTVVTSKTTVPPKAYEGKVTTIGDELKIKIPNGWTASVSSSTNFLAVMFARPGQLESLIYNPDKPPAVDYNGIPAWSGLTEHFYIRQMTTPSQNFAPGDHDEVSSKKFTFDDNTTGKKYMVTKRTPEANKYGGLQKDAKWHGRVFVYEKDSKRVEAHLAFYPSSKIDEIFYEKVAKSIHF